MAQPLKTLAKYGFKQGDKVKLRHNCSDAIIGEVYVVTEHGELHGRDGEGRLRTGMCSCINENWLHYNPQNLIIKTILCLDAQSVKKN